MPDNLSRQLTVCGNDLVVIALFLNIENRKLLSGKLSPLYHLANNDKTNFFFAKRKKKLANCAIARDLLPIAYMKDKLLYPRLLRHNDIVFNPTPPEPFEKIPAEKTAISPQSPGRLPRKFLKDPCYQIPGLITAVTVARV